MLLLGLHKGFFKSASQPVVVQLCGFSAQSQLTLCNQRLPTGDVMFPGLKLMLIVNHLDFISQLFSTSVISGGRHCVIFEPSNKHTLDPFLCLRIFLLHTFKSNSSVIYLLLDTINQNIQHFKSFCKQFFFFFFFLINTLGIMVMGRATMAKK